ncbi:MAG TPA: arylsulfatase [Armatimonadota bacterium]|nr:arylsulfatase [Armatimonadota bacterium]
MSHRMSRREALKAMGLGAAALGVPRSAEAIPPARRPNIIFILADDLGYGDVGCYGQERIQTPRIDQLAREGVRFTDCYSGSTVCAPSRCCLMTGLHTGHARIRGNADVPLRPEDQTVAETLKAAGYATGIVGKWGLGNAGTTGIPNRQGFDEWFGYLDQTLAHNYYPPTLWRNEREVPLLGNQNGATNEYSHDLFTREAEAFIRRHAGGPFFLYLAYTIPHANNELGAKTGNGMEVPSDVPYTDQPWPQPEKNKAAMITRMDRDIGHLMDVLEELDIEEDTIVFFSSDNGPHKEGGIAPAFFGSSGPLRGIKRAMYDGGIRVPMIVRWPGRTPAGAVSDYPWAFWDFLPTAAQLGGAPIPKGLDGLSVVPALLGQPGPEREYLYWEFHEGGFSQALRMGRWKAVRNSRRSAPIELYDITTDIGEQTDVSTVHPELVAKAEKLFVSARTDSPEFAVKEE